MMTSEGGEAIVMVSTVIFGCGSCGLTKPLQLIKDGRNIAKWNQNGALTILASDPEDRDFAVVFATLFFSGFMNRFISRQFRDWYSASSGLRVYS
jgi:hypothetical protein